MDEIHRELLAGEISREWAIDRVLYHQDFGGNRDDAKAVVDEWLECHCFLPRHDDCRKWGYPKGCYWAQREPSATT